MISVDGRGGDMRGTAFAFQIYEPGQRKKMMDGSNMALTLWSILWAVLAGNQAT